MKNKHKWWEHIFFKYKEIRFCDEIEEAERPRLWFAIVLILLALIISPFIILWFLISFLKELFFPTKDEKNKKTKEN